MKRLFIGGVVALVFLSTAVSASAQSGTTTTTPATTAGPATAKPPTTGAPGVTATSIKVAGVGYALLYGGADVGAKARFQRANDTGGVNGRTINYAGFADDGGNPAVTTALATALVQQQAVFAVVPAVTGNFTASSYLVQQKVPYFGWALSSSFCGTRYGFGFNGCQVPKGVTSNSWPILIAKLIGATAAGRAVAILAENTPTGQYEVTSLTAAAQSAKFKVVYGKATLDVPATVDYDGAAKAVLTSNAGKSPDIVFVVGGPSNVLGMQLALAANGFLGVFTNEIEYAPDLVAPAIGAQVMTQTAPTESAPTNPAMAQLVKDVQKVAPDQPINQAVIAGYWSADLFLAAVKKAGKNLTTASLVKAANNNFTYRVPNTVGPTTFPAAHSLPTPCGALVASDGTVYAVKVPYSCARIIPVK